MEMRALSMSGNRWAMVAWIGRLGRGSMPVWVEWIRVESGRDTVMGLLVVVTLISWLVATGKK